MRLLLPFFLIILFSLSSFAQTGPQLVEPGIISTGGVFGFALSPDGNEAFWVKSNGGRDTLIIMHAHKVRGNWQTPAPASFSGNVGVWKDIDPVFSPDGSMVLFQSNRPVAGKPDRTGFDIWAVKRTKKGWSDPYHLGNVINSDDSESFASITRRGHIYFMRDNPDKVGSSDIYVSRLIKGVYQEPVNVGLPINTTFRESNPFISPDEDYIIYFSSDSTGYGDVDLFISYHTDNQWSTPENLGKPINSAIGEFCPFYHTRQKKLYFCRIERKNGRLVENVYSYSFQPK